MRESKSTLIIPQVISTVLIILITSIIFSRDILNFTSRVIITLIIGIIVSFSTFGIFNLIQKNKTNTVEEEN